MPRGRHSSPEEVLLNRLEASFPTDTVLQRDNFQYKIEHNVIGLEAIITYRKVPPATYTVIRNQREITIRPPLPPSTHLEILKDLQNLAQKQI